MIILIAFVMKLLKFLIALFFITSVYSVENGDPPFTFGKYLFLDLGIGSGSYRDEGTSPLLYEGPAATLSNGYLSEDPKHTFELRLNTNYIGGFIEEGHMEHQFSEDIQLSYLHTLPILNNNNMILKAGGRFSTSLSGAYNDAFQNASLNIDIFSSLCARANFTYAFIKPEKQKKRRTVPESKHALICNLELPLILFNARPEFPYVMDGNAISYNRHIFLGGYSMQSDIAFRSFLPNGNAFEISYIWKMYITGKRDIYLMERASHILKLSYYFKLD
jgi:hypothetical protein